MRIAVIGALGVPARGGGVNRHCEEVYARLAARGHSVTVFSRRYYTKERSWRGMRVVPLPVPRLRGVETVAYAFLATLAACVRRVDVVHFHSVVSTTFAFLPRLRGIRVLVTMHSFDRAHQKWGKLAKLALWWNERMAVRSAHALLAVSRALAADLRSRFPGVEVAYTPNGTPELTGGDPGDIAPLGLQSGRYVLSVGRLLPEKGVHVLVDAFSRLPPDADVELAVVGAPRYTDEYVDTLQARAGPRVRFLGLRTEDELDALYHHAAVFVAPSLAEGFNITLLEAMSHGIPVVASDIPAHMEVLGGAGTVFRAGDASDLARALTRVLSDDALRESLRDAGLRRVRDAADYDWDKTAARVDEVLASLPKRTSRK